MSKLDLSYIVKEVTAPPPQIRKTKYGLLMGELFAKTSSKWRAFHFKDENVVRRIGVTLKRHAAKNQVEVKTVAGVLYLRKKGSKGLVSRKAKQTTEQSAAS